MAQRNNRRIIVMWLQRRMVGIVGIIGIIIRILLINLRWNIIAIIMNDNLWLATVLIKIRLS
jgi:hypothetical protein